MKYLAGKKVLVVDDEQILRDILREELEEAGCTVFQSENGRQALEVANREKVDLGSFGFKNARWRWRGTFDSITRAE